MINRKRIQMLSHLNKRAGQGQLLLVIKGKLLQLASPGLNGRKSQTITSGLSGQFNRGVELFIVEAADRLMQIDIRKIGSFPKSHP
jgi:hypothetical protein